ncbi:hypothetical protein HY227_01490 [Candidatus Wolfebacteria bacterium]|nr:hypothetical protein [Candidatus Wolfebacteria bacterium]
MRGSITLKILEMIEGMVVNAIDTTDANLSSGYGASSGKIQYELSKIKKERNRKDLENELRRKYQKMIYKLKKDGLIEIKNKNNNKFFTLTQRGKKKISALKNKLLGAEYKKEQGDKIIIVIFDIPENQKKKREWLRWVLKNLEFKMIQKSVWLGKTKIPQEFIKDLNNLKLIDFVEIFEITKTGSLKEIY